MLMDRQTGAEVEVDVVIESVTAEVPVTISLEVRSRKRPGTVEWVREMLGKHSTLGTNKLVLVSQSGFTQEALAKAKQNNIEAITLEEAKEFDWSTIVKEIVGKDSLYLASFNMKCTNFSMRFMEIPLDQRQKAEALVPKGVGPNTQFFISETKERGTLKQIPAALLHNRKIAEAIMQRWIKEGKETFTVTWNVPKGSYIEDQSGNIYYIESFEVKGECDVPRVSVKFKHGAFRDTQVVHATAPNIFGGEDTSGVVTLSIIEQEGRPAKGALVLPKPNEAGRRVFEMQVPLQEEEQ